MKNLIYAGVIGVCLLAAVLVFMSTRGGNSSGASISDSERIWVKCLKCGQGYEMSLKQYIKERGEKSAASPAGIAVAPLLTCQKCGKDGIVEAYKCEKCGEIFRKASVPGDLPDRCPKCKYSATEAKRAANKAKQQP
jgi:hypothetical protein